MSLHHPHKTIWAPRAAELLAASLREPSRLQSLDAPRWEAFIRQARAAGLLARVGSLLDARGLLAHVPPGPRAHFVAAMRLAQAQHEETLRELDHVRQALAATGVEPIVLKGAAYVAAGLPAALGRVFTDLDILVPKQRLPEVEAALMAHGWATSHHTPYDQHYYRRWMHELPPMRHVTRGTVIDVHHAIVPETARAKSSAALLIEAARPLPAHAPFRVLSGADMVLHSMVHLFNNDDLTHALRDLSDLDLLLRARSADSAFWGELEDRASALNLRRPLHLGLRHTQAILATPVPRGIAERLSSASGPGTTLADAVWRRALRPRHRTADDRWTGLAIAALHANAHRLRMPTGLLLLHLTVKALHLHELGARRRAAPERA